MDPPVPPALTPVWILTGQPNFKAMLGRESPSFISYSKKESSSLGLDLKIKENRLNQRKQDKSKKIGQIM
jgi:hypothetical protein